MAGSAWAYANWDWLSKTASLTEPASAPLNRNLEEREEFARTHYLDKTSFTAGVQTHVTAFLAQPLNYLCGLWFALQLGHRKLSKWPEQLRLFHAAILVGDWMAENELTHLHVRYDATLTATIGLIAAKTFGIAFSLTVNELTHEIPATQAALLPQMLASAGYVTCPNNFMRSQLMQLTPLSDWSKYELAPRGIVADCFQPVERWEQPRLFEVLSVGDMKAPQGQPVLIGALERLLREGRQLRVRLVGDGPERATLETIVEQRGLQHSVIFENTATPERLRDLYAQANAFVHTSFDRQLPMNLLEALAMQLPCVATNVAGIAEIIRNGLEGLLVTPASEEDMAEALALLLDDPMLRAEMGLAGQDRVLDKYNANENLARLAAIHFRRLNGLKVRTETQSLELATLSL